MKIKKSFITNSSSTNYIMLAKQVSYYNVLKDESREIWCMGKWLDGGIDLFMLTQPMKDLLKQIKPEMVSYEVNFYEVFGIQFENGEICLKCIADRPDIKDLHAIGGECDQNSTNTVEDFVREYVTWTDRLFKGEKL